MKTQNFDNDTRTLTLVKVVNTKSDYTYTHFFETEDGDTVAINTNIYNNFGKWLCDNCDIKNTSENIELLKAMLK